MLHIFSVFVISNPLTFLNFGKLTKEPKKINSNIKTLLSTGLTKHLRQGVEGSAASSTSVSDLDNSLDSPSVNEEASSQFSATVEEITTKPYKSELLSSAVITPIFTKSRNRSNFVALLVKRLFDVLTRTRSNVSGRGKEKLDPEIMAYIKAKEFEYYECNPWEVKIVGKMYHCH